MQALSGRRLTGASLPNLPQSIAARQRVLRLLRPLFRRASLSEASPKFAFRALLHDLRLAGADGVCPIAQARLDSVCPVGAVCAGSLEVAGGTPAPFSERGLERSDLAAGRPAEHIGVHGRSGSSCEFLPADRLLAGRACAYAASRSHLHLSGPDAPSSARVGGPPDAALCWDAAEARGAPGATGFLACAKEDGHSRRQGRFRRS